MDSIMDTSIETSQYKNQYKAAGLYPAVQNELMSNVYGYQNELGTRLSGILREGES